MESKYEEAGVSYSPTNGENILSPPDYRYEKSLVTTKEWVHENITSDPIGRVRRYLVSLFPIFSWIYRYNLTWAIGGNHLFKNVGL